jgi:hypothetical protein
VADEVMRRAGILPEDDIIETGVEDEDLSAFRDFVDSLNLDDLSS